MELGSRAHPTSVALRAAGKRAKVLGASAVAGDIATAISPDRPRPLIAAYAGGSFLNGFPKWWGRRHPGKSGFATREHWARVRTAARLAPDRTDFFADYAAALRGAYRWDQAKAILCRRLTAAPGDARCHFLLAGVLADNKATPEREAEVHGREALRLAPHLPAAEVQIDRLLLRRNNVAGSITLLDGALTRDPYNASALNSLASARARSGKKNLPTTCSSGRTPFSRTSSASACWKAGARKTS